VKPSLKQNFEEVKVLVEVVVATVQFGHLYAGFRTLRTRPAFFVEEQLEE